MMLRLVAFLVLLPALASAATTEATYDVYLRGLKVAVLAISGEERGGRYAARGRLESTGVAGMVRRVRYDAAARGRNSARGFEPQRYSEDTDTGKRQSRAVMEYRRGRPQVKSYDPPRRPDREDLDPATQGGTVDPMTAIWGVLRAVPEAQACRFSAPIFDGARRSRVTLSDRRREGDAIHCRGEYRRVAGFSDEDMREKTRFPFRLRYERRADGRWQVVRMESDTLYGVGSFVLR